MGRQTASATGSTMLLWIFVLSGFAGLIYQSIWTQYLGLFLGHSSYAQSLVLILFMGGMALGAWLASRFTERLGRPLLIYAAIELVIGVFGLTFDSAFGFSTAFAYENIFPLLGSAQAASMLRWALSITLVFPACVLLGATFPLMSAGVLRLHPSDGGRVLSGLYFTNSIGAAAGALVATYLLLPNVGLPGTVMSAGLLNIAVAILVYPIGKAEYPPVRVQPETRAAPKKTFALILAIAAATGATSFVYEIVWIRMLSLAVGTTLHAFELMLAAFISGIAFGGLWLRTRADRMKSPLRAAGWIQILMALAALASLFIYASAFEWVGWLMRVLVRSAEGYVAYNFATGAIALAVMFPAAFFAGMTLPLLTLSMLRSRGGERAIGRTYAANTLGAIAGVLLAIHVLMPLVGVKLALWVAACVDLVLGLVLLAHTRDSVAELSRRRTGIAIAVASGILISSLFIRFDPLMLASSVYRTGTPVLQSDAEMLFYKDGKTASVAVYESGPSDARVYSIATNGKVDAGLSKSVEAEPRLDEFTMTLLPALPLAIKPDAANVAVIGFGSGMTTHTLLGSSVVQRVDTVEIEPAMVEGARHFKSRVPLAFDDPRSRIIIDDAKAYFSSTQLKYDLIISEPSNPWMGGTASLFTEQFYDFIPNHLGEGGLFVQWLQLYEIDMRLVASVLRAMLPRFNDVNAYLSQEGDLILVASPSGVVPEIGSLDGMGERLTTELERIGVETARDLQDTFVLDMVGLSALSAMFETQANSDLYPVLQLNAPRARFVGSSVSIFGDVATAPWPISASLGEINRRSLELSLPRTHRQIPVDRKLRAAREIRAFMVGEAAPEPEFTRYSDAVQMDALRGLGGACLLDQNPGRSAHLIFSLAMETIPFLHPDDHVALWESPAWLSCEPKSRLVVSALELVSAAAREDHYAVIRVGSELLEGGDADTVRSSPDSYFYVRGAIQFSAFRLGRSDIARHLIDTYDGQPDTTFAAHPLLQLLNSLSIRVAAPEDQSPQGPFGVGAAH